MKNHPNRSKPQPWFKYVRRSYLPASPVGLLIYLAYLTYEVLLLLNWYHQGHNFGHLLTGTLPLAIAAAVLTQFVAARNSR